MSDEVLAALYRGAQCLIFTSLYEVRCRCSRRWRVTPVVTTNFGATAELVQDAAVLVDPYDVDAIADGIAEARRRRDELRAAA